MRRKSFLALGALAVFVCVAQPLFGCGDKLVLLGRGIRFQRMIATKHPATILVYLNPDAGISAADREYQLRPLLKLAGHSPRSVATPTDLARELGSGTYDLILADYADAAALEKEIVAAKAKSTLIPIIYNPTAEQRAAAEKDYACLVAPAKRNFDLLKVIDQVMASPRESAGAKCRRLQV